MFIAFMATLSLNAQPKGFLQAPLLDLDKIESELKEIKKKALLAEALAEKLSEDKSIFPSWKYKINEVDDALKSFLKNTQEELPEIESELDLLRELREEENLSYTQLAQSSPANQLKMILGMSSISQSLEFISKDINYIDKLYSEASSMVTWDIAKSTEHIVPEHYVNDLFQAYPQKALYAIDERIMNYGTNLTVAIALTKRHLQLTTKQD